MRAPKVHESLSWGKRKGQYVHKKDAELVSRAVSSINKFSNDGNFMQDFIKQPDKAVVGSPDAANPKSGEIHESQFDSSVQKSVEEKQPLSANQLAAKAMQLRFKGKHEEAEKLLVRYHLMFLLPDYSSRFLFCPRLLAVDVKFCSE